MASAEEPSSTQGHGLGEEGVTHQYQVHGDSLDMAALNRVHDILEKKGYGVVDGSLIHQAGGTHGEVVVDHNLSPRARARRELNRLGFVMIEGGTDQLH